MSSYIPSKDGSNGEDIERLGSGRYVRVKLLVLVPESVYEDWESRTMVVSTPDNIKDIVEHRLKGLNRGIKVKVEN